MADPLLDPYVGDQFTLVTSPHSVGHYQIGGPIGLRIVLRQRPSWVARLFTRWLLDWVWVDNG